MNMPYVLLWVESLAASLLLVTTVWACVARMRRAWAKGLLLAFSVLAPLTVYLVAAGAAGFVFSRYGGLMVGFFATLGLLGCFLAGVVWIARRARRDGGDGRPAGASWPRGRLAAALAGVAMLHAMTLWNLDLACRQRLAALRADASAVALAAAPVRVPDRDNAALDYQDAFHLLCPDGQFVKGWKDSWDTNHASGSPLPDANDPDLQRFLAGQEQAHHLLLQAAAKSGCYFDRDYYAPSASLRVPEVMQFRRAAAFLSLSARQRAADEDVRGALADVNACFALADHAGNCPLLIHVLVAAAADRMAIGALQTVLAARPVGAEALAAVRIDPAMSYHRQLQRAMRSEEAFRLAIFADVGQGAVSATAMGDTWPLFWIAMPYRIFLLQDDLASHQRLSAKCRESAAKPYYQSRQGMQGMDAAIRERPVGVLTAMLAPALSRFAEMAALADARRATARAALAAARYRAAHGKLPDKPEDLLGESMPLWPSDPFDGKPLRWKQTGKELVIYSIGPDCKDDGGTPLETSRSTGDIAFRVGG
jgi:hypothetical protein